MNEESILLKSSPKELGKRIAIVMKENGDLSYREFGTLCDVSHTTIANAVKGGKNEINFNILRTICIKLGYSSNWLILGQGNKRPEKKIKPYVDMQRFMVELDLERASRQKLEANINALYKRVEYLEKGL